MKFLSLGFVFLYAFMQQSAYGNETMDVFADQVWVYPALAASHQIMEERGGKNHFLNTQVVFNPEETQARIAQAQSVHPGKDVYVYKLSYVEATIAIPQLPRQELRYSEQMDGWELKANYQKIPHSELESVKKFLTLNNGLKIVVGYYKRSMKEEEVYSTHCLLSASTNEGISWLFRRLKTFEKDVAALISKEKLSWDKLLNDFTLACTNVEARGVESFSELAKEWRVKGVDGKFSVKLKKMKENYRQIEIKPQSTMVTYEF